jgi:glyoxylase I family protein
MFNGLEHTAIASPDPKTLANWYVNNLDFQISYSYDVFYFIKAPNGGVLEIMPAEGPRVEQGMQSPGIRHLAIQVDDFDAAYEQLKSRGVKFVNEPYLLRGNRLVFFNDCDGNLVHLIKRDKPLP